MPNFHFFFPNQFMVVVELKPSPVVIVGEAGVVFLGL